MSLPDPSPSPRLGRAARLARPARGARLLAAVAVFLCVALAGASAPVRAQDDPGDYDPEDPGASDALPSPDEGLPAAPPPVDLAPAAQPPLDPAPTAQPPLDPAPAAPPLPEAAAARARGRAQAFLLPLDEAARAAAARVAEGVAAAISRSADDLIDLEAPLALEGPQGAASLSALVARAAAEADRRECGPELRRLSARFSLDRVVVGSVAVRGADVAVRLTVADARRGRLLGQQTLSLPAAATGAEAVEARAEAAVRSLLDAATSSPSPAGAEPPGSQLPEPAARATAASGRGAPSGSSLWKRGLFDKTGTEEWDLPDRR